MSTYPAKKLAKILKPSLNRKVSRVTGVLSVPSNKPRVMTIPVGASNSGSPGVCTRTWGVYELFPMLSAHFW